MIETIGTAYSQLVSRPYIILAPILIDLYLWLGMRISAGPLARKLSNELDAVPFVGDNLAGFVEGREGYNLFELASMQILPTLRMPTFLPLGADDELTTLGGWQPDTSSPAWWIVAALIPVLASAGYVVGAEFFIWLFDVVRGRAHSVDPRRAVRTAWELFLWLAIGIGLLLLATGPLLIGQLVSVEAGAGASPFLALIALIPAGVAFVLFFFSIYAIVVDQISAIEAYRASYRLVRRNLGASLGFIAIYIVITSGFPLFWGVLLTDPAGTLLAIIGNAFVASGIIAAAMLYYDERAPLANAVTKSS